MQAQFASKCVISGRKVEIGDEIVKVQGKGWALKSEAAKAQAQDNPTCECGMALDVSRAWTGICVACRKELLSVAKWTVKNVREAMRRDNAFLERAIVRLYERQTEDEQQAADTKYLNSVGFNSPDAGKLSRNARWILRGNHLDGAHLTDARQRMMKYASQVAEIANESMLARDLVAGDRHLGSDRDALGSPVEGTKAKKERVDRVIQSGTFQLNFEGVEVR